MGAQALRRAWERRLCDGHGSAGSATDMGAQALRRVWERRPCAAANKKVLINYIIIV